MKQFIKFCKELLRINLKSKKSEKQITLNVYGNNNKVTIVDNPKSAHKEAG